MQFESMSADLLWRYALAAIPVVLCVAVISRVLPCRPATRYSLWLIALVSILALPHLPTVPVPMPSWAVATEPALDGATPAAAVASDIDYSDLTPFEPARRAGAGATETPRPAPALTFDVELDEPPTLPSFEPIFDPSFERAFARSAERAPRPMLATGEVVEPRSTPAGPPADDGRLRPVPSREAPPKRAESDLDRWKVQLAALREAVMGLPPIPTTVWGGGVALLVVVLVFRMIRARRLIRRARPASFEITRMVAEESSRMKLRRAPTTMMVDARISPMVWCGRTPRMLLPVTLWMQLDDLGRRTVILHELAHLRRRDHWVCWIELIVGCLYWWHPVVWWIRRRLRDEADLCCDAWVTALLPMSRRHYAQALLNTRAYVSELRPAGPVVGLGVTSVRAKRFARRLTMVMTDPSDGAAAKLSLRGLALAATVALGAYLVTPVLACPPTPKDAAKSRPDKPPVAYKYKVPKAPKAPKAPRAPMAATAPKAPKAMKAPKAPKAASRPAPPAPDSETTFEQFMRSRGGDDAGSVEQRIERLEQQLQKLYERLERLMEQRQSRSFSPVHPMPEVAMPDLPPLPPDVAAPSPLSFDKRAYSDGEQIAREYRLPRGKLQALANLMARNDVPILVEPKCETLRVHATPHQHEVLDSFCRMIDRKEEKHAQEYRMAEDKLAALTRLMVRSDVPIMVEPKCKSLRVHGTPEELAVFNAFCRMINDEAAAPIKPQHPIYARNASGPANELLQIANAYQHRAVQEIQQRQGLESVLRGLHAQIDSLAQQADALRRQADVLRGDADELESKADDLVDDSEDLDRRRQAAARQQANAMMVQCRSLGRQAEQMDRQAERVERQAERVESQVDDLESRLDELDYEDQ